MKNRMLRLLFFAGTVAMVTLAGCGRSLRPPLPTDAVVVQTVSVASDGTPLIRNPRGQFAKYYWHDGALHVPEAIAGDTLAQALSARPTATPAAP